MLERLNLRSQAVTHDGVSTYERLLQAIGFTGLPGVHRIVGRLAPKYELTRPFQSHFFGLTYAGDLSDMIDWNIFFFGAYSRGELEFLDRCVDILSARSDELNFFDVGANTGQHSLFMSRKVREVHAFEPSSTVADRFQLNISLNGLKNVHLHRVALADMDGKAALGSGFPGNSGSRSLNWSLPGMATETVAIQHADAYLRTRDLPRMHILKLDVEGHEKKVLKGLKARLLADRPVLIMELIGQKEKGGFTSPEELHRALYPRHELRSLKERHGRHQLISFDWHCECAVVLPNELSREFAWS